MNAAETAYEAAERAIALALREGKETLDFSGKEFRALTHLPPEIAGLTALQSLDLRHTAVADIAPLAGLTALQILGLSQTSVADIAPLAGLTALRFLSLIQTAVAELSPLARLTALQHLWLNQTAVADIAPLAHLTALQFLDLDQTAVADIAPLARLTALQSLGLSQTAVADIAPLAGLGEALEWLSLQDTRVADLSPISRLWLLRVLVLDGSEVADLRPIVGLNKLSTIGPPGLAFRDTTATRQDGELARLADILDTETRARETLAYLRTLPPWPQPYTPKPGPDGKPPEPIGRGEPPEQDPALPLIWGEKGFSFLAEQASADPVTEAALDDLRPLLEDLRRKGNRHDDLYRLAGELQDRSSGAISGLNLIKLHLSYQKLRRVYEGRESRAERFDDETVSVMGSVLEIVPGVTLADAGVQVLIARQEQERARKPAPEAMAAEEKILQSVQEEAAPFEPAVKDAAQAMLQPGLDDRLAASRGILSRNTVVVVLTYIGTKAVDGAIGGPVGNFLYEHGAAFMAFAQTMGSDAFFWAQMVFSTFKGQYELTMGLAREAMGSGALRLPPKGKTKP